MSQLVKSLIIIAISALIPADTLKTRATKNPGSCSLYSLHSHEPFLLAPSSVRYFQDSVNLTMPPQSGNTCLPAILAYVNKEKCKGNKAATYFIDRYEATHPGVNVIEDGIIGSKKEIVDFIQSDFKTMSYDDVGGVVSSINAGWPLLTTIAVFDMYGQKLAHSVLIIGYDSTSKPSPKVYYMDPLQGKVFKDIDIAKFEKSSPAFALSIMDCK
jgi:hypothetical protein